MNRRTLLTTLLSGLSAGVVISKTEAKADVIATPSLPGSPRVSKFDNPAGNYNLKVDSLGIDTYIRSYGWRDDHETSYVERIPFHVVHGRDWDISGINQESAEKLLASMVKPEKISFELSNGVHKTSFSGFLSELCLDIEYDNEKYYKAVIADA